MKKVFIRENAGAFLDFGYDIEKIYFPPVEIKTWSEYIQIIGRVGKLVGEVIEYTSKELIATSCQNFSHLKRKSEKQNKSKAPPASNFFTSI